MVEPGGWAHVLPDPVEPLLHVYAEGATREASAGLEADLHALVEEAMKGEESEQAAQIST